jgi:signal transduction protein with GAF and PtsI domain
MEDDYLRERVSDLKDLGRRILASLQEADSSHRELSPDSILLVKKSAQPHWLNYLSIKLLPLSPQKVRPIHIW